MELRIEFVKIIPEILEEKILYVSEEYEVSIHLCPCGCKNEVVVPFSEKGWQYKNENGMITLSPSIGNYQLPCKSHYFIKSNQICFA